MYLLEKNRKLKYIPCIFEEEQASGEAVSTAIAFDKICNCEQKAHTAVTTAKMRTQTDVRIPYVADPIVLFPSGRHRLDEILTRAYLANEFRQAKAVTTFCQTYPLELNQQAKLLQLLTNLLTTTTPLTTNLTTLQLTHTTN